MRNLLRLLPAFAIFALCAEPAAAQKKYDPGASDTEIKIGNVAPYSGPMSAYGLIARTISAYFTKVNSEGGINGRKIKFLSYDDGYSPPKTVEQARKLIENDGVLFIFASLGTPPNTAIERYMNSKRVPQLFVGAGATKFGDPKNYPWTMGWQPTYQNEARIYAKYLIEHHPNGKIGVLYQNDDYGKDYLQGLKAGLAGKIPIISEQTYESTDPASNSQIISLKGTGADILFDVTLGKFAAQAIRKVAELGWRPVHLLNNVATSVGSVLEPAGLENAKDILSSKYVKDPTDPAWKDDPDFKQWLAFLETYFPDADRTSSSTVTGYALTATVVQVLRQCGDDLTRENVMRQAANLRDVKIPMLLPGILINTTVDDYFPIKQMQMGRFTGERWEQFGPVFSGKVGS
jgi:branched-chain amino acid transport system substrate-binding protein